MAEVAKEAQILRAFAEAIYNLRECTVDLLEEVDIIGSSRKEVNLLDALSRLDRAGVSLILAKERASEYWDTATLRQVSNSDAPQWEASVQIEGSKIRKGRTNND